MQTIFQDFIRRGKYINLKLHALFIKCKITRNLVK